MRSKIRAFHLVLATVALVSHISLECLSMADESKATTSGGPTTALPAVPKSEAPLTTPTSTKTTTTTASTSAPSTVASPVLVRAGATAATLNNSSQDPKDIEGVKKIISLHIDANRGENRLVVNRPTLAPIMFEFAPESIEARVSDATAQFGLHFINSLSNGVNENVIISPLSLQNLLNMLLIGTSDNSTTQLELSKVLGYDATDLLEEPSADRLKPHEAMRSVYQSILAATHLSVDGGYSEQLLNTNSGSLPATTTATSEEKSSTKGLIAAHLQTSNREGDDALCGQVNFTLANLVLTNKDLVELAPNYEKDLKTYYNVNIEEFSRTHPKDNNKERPAEGGAQCCFNLPLHERVNKWVKNMTHGQIDKLVNEGDLSASDLAMVLLNAAHFKGRWLHTFNTKASSDKTFFNYGTEKGASKVKFMRQKAVFGYADFSTNSLSQANSEFSTSFLDGKTKSIEDAETLLTEDNTATGKSGQSSHDNLSAASAPPTIELSKEDARRLELTNKLNCTVLMLPFSLNEGQELSMIILLPSKRDGVAELQANLDAAALNEIYKSLSEQQVQVEMPKFSFEGSHDAKETLVKMNLKSIFRETANFDRMFVGKAGRGKAKVDKIVHKAKISVDESGAEAAAASMATIVLRNFIRPPTPIFVADHPFLFIIRHNRSNMPLFMGRVSNL